MDSLLNTIKTQKLTLSFMLIILLFASSGTYTIKGLFTLGHLTKTIYNHPLVVSNASLHAALNLTKMHRSMKDAVLADDAAEIEAVLEDIDGDERKVYRHLDTIRKEILGEDGQALEKQTRQLFSDWAPIRKEVVRLLRAGN
ncbi:hypothetical protein DSCA_29270 [Desulfosarcina alkanivorans]|jgi:hypothetical protein|uniref:Chemotaxis methyl-accepting receptor HlyB-like 4HB MCP domain-containing protein n=1 Tax=Desulfosarcina alkanivorans TaxID=571177 RepID=A0A5K7YWE2_9BACT|nr:MCP four helix bundle domain-containing protein [Desulfosarcina alkanivorans]BBO68997.1 hypothetical protein DSCA_29270 [Desulfosarcina alkanivorans]